MTPRLIIFDADGTLCARDSGALLPGVKAWLAEWRHGQGYPVLAIATNQGGVGCRALGGFGHPERYPTETQAIRRYRALGRALGIPAGRVYLAFAYQTKSGVWSPPPADTRYPDFWRRDWRKPTAGMLHRAMREAGVRSAETLMVGDRPEDEGAATAAGCAFQWADRFFSRN